MAVKALDRGDYVEFIGTGFVRSEEVIEAVSEFYSSVPKTLAVWNFSDGDLSSFSADQFRKVAANGARFSAARGDGARSAIVVKSDAEVMLIRAFVAMAGIVSPIPFKIFMERGTAVEWLLDPSGFADTAGLRQSRA